MGRLQQYLESRYGVPLKSSEYTYQLNPNTPTQIAMNNPNRFEIILMNISIDNIYVGFTSDVGISKGILLAASGGEIGFVARDDGELPGRALFGIAAAGTVDTPQIYVVESEAMV